MLDLSGATLAQLMVNALQSTQASNPLLPPPDPAQLAAQQAAQLATWTTICNQLLSYISTNATLTIPATGISDSSSRPCTGSSTTGTLT